MSEAQPVEILKAASMGSLPHGFLGRIGGVSTGIYAGLNVGLGSEDEREAVLENRRRAVDAVRPEAAGGGGAATAGSGLSK